MGDLLKELPQQLGPVPGGPKLLLRTAHAPGPVARRQQPLKSPPKRSDSQYWRFPTGQRKCKKPWQMHSHRHVTAHPCILVAVPFLVCRSHYGAIKNSVCAYTSCLSPGDSSDLSPSQDLRPRFSDTKKL